jgi:hypothetical protein
MRSLCSIFCWLSLFFFVLYIVIAQPHLPDLNTEAGKALIITLIVGLLAYGLHQLLRRLRFNPALWRIIYTLIGLIIVLVIIGVPEIRELLLGWLEKVSDPAETLLVLSVLFLIICVLCRTRPARSPHTL